MHRKLSSGAIVLSLSLLMLAVSSSALEGGGTADPAIAEIPLDTVTSIAKPALWTRLDAAEFWAIPRRPPADYYRAVDASSRERLRSTLHDKIANHAVFPYSTSDRPSDANHQVDTWDIIALADAHPGTPSEVLDLYLNGTFRRQLAGPTHDPRYDREHSWPKSLGFPDNTTKNPAYSDCHHLFAAYSSYNGSRSNKPYGAETPSAEHRKPTLENGGRGGSLGDETETSNYSFPAVWQTWQGRKGDVARAMFYMDVRYEGGQNEADLQLTDDASLVTNRSVWREGGKAYMGLLTVLLRWHTEDPVDDLERRRNAVVYLFQGNRNPFIDHPEWVHALFGSAGAAPPAAGETAFRINEIHYENEGDDEDEFVEIAGTAGRDLTGWKLMGYNGSGGRPYQTIALTGLLPNTGFLVVSFQSLQNGPADGVALVAPDGSTVELISYEGAFTATGGPAEGRDSVDIGVSESGTTPKGQSLQRTNAGWQGPKRATPNAASE